MNRGEHMKFGENKMMALFGTNQWVYNDPKFIVVLNIMLATITGDNVKISVIAHSLNGNVIDSYSG